MPAFGNSYRTNNPYQQKNQHFQQQQQFQHPRSISPPDVSRSFSPPAAVSGFGSRGVSAQFSTVPGVGSGGSGGNPKHRIYPKEFSPGSVFKLNQTTTTSPLLSALSNPADLFSRSFLSASPGTNSTAPSSLTGGSPPSSWPASYTNNGALPRSIGGGVPQRGNGAYPSFEEHLSRKGAYMAQRFSNLDGRTLTPGDGGYVCSFDTLDGDSENVICLGWEGGIDIWRVGKGSLDMIGRLEGLAGGVRGAKILPTPQRGDPLAALRPLIVLTIQSPIYVSSHENAPSPPSSSPESSRPRSAASFTSSRSHHTTQGGNQGPYSPEVEWQTSVEIYSLSNRERVAVLFTSPPEPSANADTGELTPPPVWGGLRVEVGDKSIALGIGMSGEVYLFTLITVMTSVQSQPVTIPIVQETTKKARKGKAGDSRRKSVPSAPIAPPTPVEIRGEWVCQGKIWTTVQLPMSGTEGSNGHNSGPAGPSLGFIQNGTPVFSLEGRWLSYLPPPANSSVSAGGIVRVSHGLAASSVMTQTPPPQPQNLVQIDIPDGEEKLINRMAREATQEVLRGAKWVGEHGMKAWQSYWNGTGGQGGNITPPSSQHPPLPSSINGGASGFGGVGGGGMNNSSGVSALGQQLQKERQIQQNIGSPYLNGNYNIPSGYSNPLSSTPPSNMNPASNTPQHQSGGYAKSAMHQGNDPILVSILDLGKFPSSSNETQTLLNQGGSQLSPLATFHPPLGVSNLSFAPGGLALLTASAKGDVYCVWDLMRMVHKPAASASGHMNSAANSPSVTSAKHIRQIARFTRMTIARIIDVVWSYPRGDRFAVLTDRGTVHFYDMPFSAYQWPPYRKPPPSAASANTSPAFNAQQAAGVVQAVQGAVSLLGSSTQPLLTAARMGRSTNSTSTAKLPSPTSGIFVNYGNARARDILPSVAGKTGGGKGSHAPAGVSKITLPGNPAVITPGSVKFLVGKEKGKVCLMGGGVLHVFQGSNGGIGGSKKRRSMISGGILLETGMAYDLPRLPYHARVARKENGHEDQLIDLDKVVGGHWSGKHHHNHQPGARLADAQYRRRDEHHQYLHNPLSFAEIETNPKYQPFHSDRRVTLSVYSDVQPITATSSVLLQQGQKPAPALYDTVRRDAQPGKNAQWVFGLPLHAEKLNLGGGRGDVEFLAGGAIEDVTDAMDSRLNLSTILDNDNESGGEAMKNRREEGGKKGTASEEGLEDGWVDFTSGV